VFTRTWLTFRVRVPHYPLLDVARYHLPKPREAVARKRVWRPRLYNLYMYYFGKYTIRYPQVLSSILTEPHHNSILYVNQKWDNELYFRVSWKKSKSAISGENYFENLSVSRSVKCYESTIRLLCELQKIVGLGSGANFTCP